MQLWNMRADGPFRSAGVRMLGRSIRATARFVSRYTWMARIAIRILAAFPGLKHRLRRGMNDEMDLPWTLETLSPRQARVLVDLQQAIGDRGTEKR